MNGPSSQFWRARRVFVTGHMGFKGAWLCALLARLGAETFGFGKDARQELLYRQLRMPRHRHCEGDVRDLSALRGAMEQARPGVIVHLAAQPIVLDSYRDPVGTFDTNVMGTVNVLEAARGIGGLEAIVVVTSDKVYRNLEWDWPYRETDALGGKDPYSASKSAAEIVAESYARSFFGASDNARVATARAGNVIGGGDWAAHRILPDAARAFRAARPLLVRNPASTRPWQHVLDPLAGYLLLAQRLVEGGAGNATSWNFGPAWDGVATVGDIADLFAAEWGGGASWTHDAGTVVAASEAKLLAVDSSRARNTLGWCQAWGTREAVVRTADWYRDNAAGADADMLVERDLTAFLDR